MHITVGHAGADINGTTHVAIQAALDRVGAMGGGAVELLPGCYTLANALWVPGGARLIGSGNDTVLVKADGWQQPLWEDGDWGDCWVRCETLPPVKVGDGVTVRSDTMGGFLSTVGTVQEIDDLRFRLNRHFNADYMVFQHANVAAAHPMIAVDSVRDVEVRDLVIDGNRANSPRLDGCRGAGVWGLFAGRTIVANVTLRNINGDGISFQHCDDWLVEHCTIEDCAGGGLHPGSGSQRPVIRHCASLRNGGWGMFVCWRVKHGLFEQNHFEGNQAGGISIGHKDTDDLFRENRILNNAGPGIFTRDETFPMAPHRGVYERNVLQGNNGGGAQVVLQGEVHDLVFRDNSYDPSAPRFEVGPKVVNLIREE